MSKALKFTVVLLVVFAMGCGTVAKRSCPFTPRDYPAAQKYIDVEGLRMSYVEKGSGDETILLIHGLGASIHTWKYNLDAFASRYHTIALDLPGHGNSEMPDIPYSVNLHANYIYKFMQEKGIEKATVVGHSVGGQVAVILALNHPEVVEKLVLAAPSGADVYLTGTFKWFTERQFVRRGAFIGIGPATGGKKRFDKIMWKWLERDGKSGYSTALVYDAHSQPTEEWLQEELDYFYDFTVCPKFPDFWRAYIKTAASVPRQFVREKLNRVDTPTLILWGEADGIIPMESVILFNKLMPLSMMSIFPETGHMVMVEDPERFNRIALEFIE